MLTYTEMLIETKLDFWAKTKNGHEISSNSIAFLMIFFGDFIKKWGHLVFFGSLVRPNFRHFFAISDMKNCLNPKLLFLVKQF